MQPLQTAADRQKQVAGIAFSAERVASRMVARLDSHKGPTITMSVDEYAEIGISMINLAAIAKEYHGLIAGAPTRDEMFATITSATEASRQLTEMIETLSAIAKRITAEPRPHEDFDASGGARP